MARRGHPEHPVPADSPAAPLARYLRELRHAADVTYRQMAATVPCRHNTLSQTVDGRLTGWTPVQTFLRALRAAAPADRPVPADAEQRARQLWEQARRRAAPAGPRVGQRAGTGPAPVGRPVTANPPPEAAPVPEPAAAPGRPPTATPANRVPENRVPENATPGSTTSAPPAGPAMTGPRGAGAQRKVVPFQA